MNLRLVELLKNPKLINSDDVKLLEGQLEKYPFMQSVRALHLYAIHLSQQEKYNKILSTTAAYTTDKKILYQFINGKIEKNKFFPIPKGDLAKSITSSVELQTSVKEFVEDGTLAEEGFVETESIILEEAKGVIIADDEMVDSSVEEQKTEVVEAPQEENISSVEEEISDIIETTPLLETIVEESNVEENVLFEDEVLVDAIEESKVDDIELINDVVVESNLSIDTVEPSAELSYHAFDAFLPEVTIEPNEINHKIEAPFSTSSNKHEDEMKRLIEEVERKMKEKKVSQTENKAVEEEAVSSDINFAETQDFLIETVQETIVEASIPEVIEEDQENLLENIEEQTIVPIDSKEEVYAEVPQSVEEVVEVAVINSSWKPMSVESHIPDALISLATQKEVVSTPPSTKVEEEPEEIVVEIAEPIISTVESGKESNQIDDFKFTEEEDEVVGSIDNQKIMSTALPEVAEQVTQNFEPEADEVPVLSMSFFSPSVSEMALKTSSLVPEEVNVIEKQKVEMVEEENSSQDSGIAHQDNTRDVSKETKVYVPNSNVSNFIHTWQDWLKIDRSTEITEQKLELREKIIDTFIENNPKISQLKDEVTFVIKEKSDDISHLMTETLANLYVEQKLYSKGIQAFKILMDKYPEKKEHFENRIQEIKELRTKN